MRLKAETFSRRTSVSRAISEDRQHFLLDSSRLKQTTLAVQQTPSQDQRINVAFKTPATIEQSSPLRENVVLGSAFVHDARRV